MQEMIQQLGFQADITEAMLIGTLMLMRILPLLFQTPFLGGKLMPAESRIGLSVGLSVLLYPYALSAMSPPFDVNGLTYIALMFKELFIGFVIGFVATELFYAMEIAGRALDVMRGSNMAEVQVPELQLRVSPIGQFNFQLLLVVFCALNGHAIFIEAVAESFRIVPLDGWPVMTAGFETMIVAIMTYTSKLFAVAFALVFPGLFTVFMVDLVFGMFNRIAPQLNAYFMAMGVKAISGLAMLMFTMGMMMEQLAHRLEEMLVFIRDLVALFG